MGTCETFLFCSWQPSFHGICLIINASESMGEFISLFLFYFFGEVMSIFILLTSLKRVFHCKDHTQLSLDLYISLRPEYNDLEYRSQISHFSLIILGIWYTFCACFSPSVKWITWHSAQILKQVTATGTDSSIISAGWEPTEENEDERDRHPSYSGSGIDDDEDFISSTSKNNQFL